MIQPTIERDGRAQTESPKKLRRILAGDLDDIVLMALRKEPSLRYASVEQFADDIRLHLDGLPVAATKSSWKYRARKFARRHTTGLAAAAVVVLAVLAGVGATLREARIAAANAQRAERRFTDVRHLANSFLFEFHDAIEHLPGSTPARELVVKRALEYLDSLSQEAGSDSSLRSELAVAYEKVGDVQGSPYRDNLGNFQGALASFQKSIAIREQLIQSSPRDQDLRSLLARNYGEIGDVFTATGDLKAALTSYHRGLDVLMNQPPSVKSRIRMEILYVRYGVGLAQSGDLTQAVDSYQKGIVIIDELLKEDPSDRENVRDKGVAYIHLADAYLQMRDLPRALTNSRTAYAVFESLIDPANAQSRRDAGVANERIADILERMGDKRNALAIRLSELAADKEAAKADPSDQLLRRDVNISCYKAAYLQSALGQMSLALENQRGCVDLGEAAVAVDPSAITRNDLQVLYFRLGEMLKKTGQNQQALRYLGKAQNLAASLAKADPKDLAVRADLAEIRMNLADVQLVLGNSVAALAGYRDALSIGESVVAANPTNSDWRILLARVHEKLGAFYAIQAAKNSPLSQNLAIWEEARDSYQKSSGIWNDLQVHNELGADYAGEPSEVSRQIAKCTAAIAARQH